MGRAKMEPIAVTNTPTTILSTANTARPVLDAAISSRLRAVARRLKGFLFVEGAARVAVFVLIAGIVQILLDYGTRGLRWSMRATLLAVLGVFVLRVLWLRVLSILVMRIEPAEMAKLAERRFPELSSLLISAVRFASGQVGSAETNSPSLIAAAVRRAGRDAGTLPLHSVLSSKRATRGGVVLLAVVGLGVAVAAIEPQMTSLWFQRNVLLREIPWPKRTHLIVDLPNGVLTGARGDDLTVQARVEGVRPREVEIRFTTESGQRGRETMAAVGRDENTHYRYTFKNAREEFTFYLEGGDDVTEQFQARLLERPRVDSAEIRVVPPKYSRLEPFSVGDSQRAVQVLPGSDVMIRIQTNKPVAKATLQAGETPVAQAAPDAGGYAVTFVPHETQTYQFALVDDVGLEDRQPARFSIRMLKDDPPRARMRVPGVGEMVTAEAVLPIELEYADTYGLAKAELLYQITRDFTQAGAIDLTGFKPGMTTYSTSLQWPVSSAGVTPGDRLELNASATDYDDVSGPNVGTSPELNVRVVTRDELLSELSRREHEYRLDFERLIDAQEQLRGRLLTAMGSPDASTTSTDFVTLATILERRQRSIAGSVHVIRQQFEQVIVEMRINQLATQTVEDRLGKGIVDPLTELARRDFVAASDTIRQWSRDPTRETAVQIDQQQVSLLKQMRAILANMIQWQGYQEAISMLRDVMRLQEELKRETADKLKEEGKGIFDK